MGAATRKRNIQIEDIRSQFEQQRGYDVVEYPMQVKGAGVFTSVFDNQLPDILKVWGEVGSPDRQLWIYQAMSLWWRSHWVTPKGNKALRNEWIVRCNLNQLAKDIWMETMLSQNTEDSMKWYAFGKSGEWGQCNYWWMRRFVCVQMLKAKHRANLLEFFPMVKVLHQGEITEQFVDLSHYDFIAQIRLQGVEIPPAIAIEELVFSQIITCEKLK